jgi:hypothetical protein
MSVLQGDRFVARKNQARNRAQNSADDESSLFHLVLQFCGLRKRFLEESTIEISTCQGPVSSVASFDLPGLLAPGLTGRYSRLEEVAKETNDSVAGELEDEVRGSVSA